MLNVISIILPQLNQGVFFQQEMLLHLSSIDMFISNVYGFIMSQSAATKRLLDFYSHKFPLILNCLKHLF